MLGATGANVYELKVKNLEARFFGGITSGSRAEGASNAEESGCTDVETLNTVVGEGLKFKEDSFLTSANLCRWVIDFNEIALGRQIGIGSYGVVHRGKWKGVEVAVKRFINQKLDERRMLEFRAEMAFLSELHHPNIVLFIGTQATTHDTTRHDQRSTDDIEVSRGLRATTKYVHRDRVCVDGEPGRDSARHLDQARVEAAAQDAAQRRGGDQLPALAPAVHRAPRSEAL
jgi:hypothetical protein